MKLIINGEERSFENVSSLTSLLENLGLKADRVAVELNREIVSECADISDRFRRVSEFVD